MNINEWSIKWKISTEAMNDLLPALGLIPEPPPSPSGAINEATTQRLVQMEASRLGGRLFRNNVGVLKDERGVPVRYGLANESKQMNANIKSSDLIGIKPILILPQHMGRTIGQFVAREIKAPGWVYTGSAREVGQARFISLISSMGGDARFANCEGTL